MIPCPHYGCNFRNENGFCKVTTCANPDYNGMTIRVANTIKVAPKTNADRIRAMSDEEMADEILRWFNWLNAVEWDDNRIIEWLKQEVDS